VRATAAVEVMTRGGIRDDFPFTTEPMHPMKDAQAWAGFQSLCSERP